MNRLFIFVIAVLIILLQISCDENNKLRDQEYFVNDKHLVVISISGETLLDVTCNYYWLNENDSTFKQATYLDVTYFVGNYELQKFDEFKIRVPPNCIVKSESVKEENNKDDKG